MKHSNCNFSQVKHEMQTKIITLHVVKIPKAVVYLIESFKQKKQTKKKKM
jgi:hypothetical protein